MTNVEAGCIEKQTNLPLCQSVHTFQGSILASLSAWSQHGRDRTVVVVSAIFLCDESRYSCHLDLLLLSFSTPINLMFQSDTIMSPLL